MTAASWVGITLRFFGAQKPTSPSKSFRRIMIVVGFFLVVVYFLVLARKGLTSYFNPDGTTNMYMGWIKPYSHLTYTSFVALWAGELRPMGTLFYKAIHDIVGFTPMPFRIACFAVMVASLRLQLSLYLELVKPVRFAFLALIVGCFNGALWSIYASTGTVFDVLCEFFVLLALLVYMHMVRLGGRAASWLLFAVNGFTIWAIQSKEMGYAISLLLLSYEICYAIPSGLRDGTALAKLIRSALVRILPIAAVGLVGISASVAKSGVLFRDPGYTPKLSWATYVQSTTAHLTMLFFRAWPLEEWAAIAILGFSLLLAILLRSREALFGWMFYNAAVAPISIVPARNDGYVLYIPYIGCALYVAGMAKGIARAAASAASWWSSNRFWSRIPKSVCWLIAAVVVTVQIYQSNTCVSKGFGPGGESLVRDMARTATQKDAGAKLRVILVDDPLGERVLAISLHPAVITKCAHARSTAGNFVGR